MRTRGGAADALLCDSRLCGARPACVQALESEEATVHYLGIAGAQGMAEASFQAGLLEHAQAHPTAALVHFLDAARRDHPGAMYNAAHLFGEAVGPASPVGSEALGRLAETLTWLGRALRTARVQGQAKVEADAITALWVWALWLQRVEAAGDPDSISRVFRAAREADDSGSASQVATAASTGASTMPQQSNAEAEDATNPAAGSTKGEEEEGARVAGWRRAISHWAEYSEAFAQTPSSQNQAALLPLRRAMQELGELAVAGGLGEFRRHLVLSKLVEGSKVPRSVGSNHPCISCGIEPPLHQLRDRTTPASAAGSNHR